MNSSFLSHEGAGKMNRSIILRFIKEHGTVSRTDIWESMSISRASVTQIIKRLTEEDLIVETGLLRAGAGRAQHQLKINENARVMFILDWNMRTLYLASLCGDMLEKQELSFPQKCIPSLFRSIVLSGIEDLKQSYPVDEKKLLGIGFIMPGLINPRDKRILFSAELEWREVNVQDLFAEDFPDRVFLERTGNMIALGEYEYGIAKGCQHVLLVLMEHEGIGASVVIRGDCQHGSSYMYGELGHIKLQNDIPCSCGQRGCLEAFVKDRMLRNGGVIDKEVIHALAVGVSTAINMCDPGVVIISGRLASLFDRKMKEAMTDEISSMVTNERSRTLRLLFSGDSSDIGMRGMSAYIFRETM